MLLTFVLEWILSLFQPKITFDLWTLCVICYEFILCVILWQISLKWAHLWTCVQSMIITWSGYDISLTVEIQIRKAANFREDTSVSHGCETISLFYLLNSGGKTLNGLDMIKLCKEDYIRSISVIGSSKMVSIFFYVSVLLKVASPKLNPIPSNFN